MLDRKQTDDWANSRQAAGELLKYRRAVKSEAALEQIFSKTAIQVFGLSPDGKQ